MSRDYALVGVGDLGGAEAPEGLLQRFGAELGGHGVACLPITFLSFAIFFRSDMVMHPGWLQVLDTALITIGTCGITFAIFGRFAEGAGANLVLRVALALGALVVMLYPTDAVATAAGALVLPAVIFGIVRHRRIAPPKGALQPQPVL
ncbi:MAG: hypothetical protein IT515_00310 [Burkholderiales bacterium]|nr:hypothetical protein [Burkholderiales bacterium]